MTHKGKWRDFTKPLPPVFEGKAREEILVTWGEHFRTRGIRTRRVMGNLKIYTKDGKRRHSPAQFTFKQGETDMGDKGKKDKGNNRKRPSLIQRKNEN
jgi:hypothetical protein